MFRIYWFGHLISGIGDYFTIVALPIAALRISGSTVAVSLVEFAELIATFVFGMTLGALADRMHPRRVMVLTSVLRGSAMVILASWFALGDPPVALLIGLSFLLGALRNFHVSAENVMVATVVAEPKLQAANARFEVSDGVGHIVGTLLAGIVSGVSVALAFGIDALTFVAALGAVVAMGRFRVDPPAVDEVRPPPWRSSIAIVRSEGRYWKMLVVVGIATIVSACMLGQFIAFAERDLGIETWQMGCTLALIGVGNIVGGIIAERSTRLPDGLLMLTTGSMAFATIATGLARSWTVSNVAFFVLGFAIAIQAAILGTHRHTSFVATVQGRVSVVHRVVIDSFLVPAILLSGVIAHRYGSATLFVAFGLVALLAPLAGFVFGLGRPRTPPTLIDLSEPEAVIDLRQFDTGEPSWLASEMQPTPREAARREARPALAALPAPPVRPVEWVAVTIPPREGDHLDWVDPDGLAAIAAALRTELDG